MLQLPHTQRCVSKGRGKSGTLIYIQVGTVRSFLWLLFTHYQPEMSSATEGGGGKEAKTEKSPLSYMFCNLEKNNYSFSCAIPKGNIRIKKSEQVISGFLGFILNSHYMVSRPSFQLLKKVVKVYLCTAFSSIFPFLHFLPLPWLSYPLSIFLQKLLLLF